MAKLNSIVGNNGKIIIEFLPPLAPEDFAVPAREAARQVWTLMAEKIAALDSELASDYTAPTTTVAG